MEPDFHPGDLVLARTESTYGVGDAVIYRNAEMDSFVFHRIIGLELDRFVLKGDNNSWLDSYQPVQDEIVGKLWLHIPKFGKAIEWVRMPIHMSLTIGLLGGVLMFDMFKKPSQRKKEKNAPLSNFGKALEGTLYGFGFLALSFLALGIYSLTRPLNRPAENIPYSQEGIFFYSATGTPGIYDTDMVRSGEPVFPKLTCFLNIGFTYNIIGDRLQGISGNHKMYARVLDEQSGWQRTIPLNPETSFNGNSYFSTATLDLCQVESLVNLVEQEAGLKQIAYTLEIVTNVAFTASVEGNQISDSFSPSLVFKYDKVHFYLATDESQTDPLRSSEQKLAGSSSFQPNTISLLGLKLSIWVVRFVSLLGFGFSLLGLIVVGINVYRTASQSQEALIRLRYGAMLVNVYEQDLALSTTTIIDVTTMDDLARLAERHSTMILHMTRKFLHYYFVQSNGTTYRYLISTSKKGIVETVRPGGEIVKRAEPVKKEPAFVPPPIRAESLKDKADRHENQTVHAFPIQNKKPEPVVVRADQRKVANAQPVLKEATEYVIDTDRIKNAKPVPKESIEYVIDTGMIEFVMPQQETKVLRKIELQKCDPRFAS